MSKNGRQQARQDLLAKGPRRSNLSKMRLQNLDASELIGGNPNELRKEAHQASYSDSSSPGRERSMEGSSTRSATDAMRTVRPLWRRRKVDGSTGKRPCMRLPSVCFRDPQDSREGPYPSGGGLMTRCKGGDHRFMQRDDGMRCFFCGLRKPCPIIHVRCSWCKELFPWMPRVSQLVLGIKRCCTPHCEARLKSWERERKVRVA